MPTLPTLRIDNQAVWDRLLEAFNSDPQEYKEWLRVTLRDELEARERRQVSDSAAESMNQISEELRGFLDEAT